MRTATMAPTHDVRRLLMTTSTAGGGEGGWRAWVRPGRTGRWAAAGTYPTEDAATDAAIGHSVCSDWQVLPAGLGDPNREGAGA